MKTILNIIKNFALFFLITLSSEQILSQSYSLDEPVLVPVFVGSAPDITQRNYFWDISEVNNTNSRLDIAVGLNQILNSTVYNYINGNWYKNQYDDNFNSENTSTRYVYQSGYQINISNITGMVFSRINTSSGKKDLIVSRGDSIFVFRSTSGSINTSYDQRFYFGCAIQSSGRFSTDNAEDIAVLRNDSIFIFKGKGTESLLDSTNFFKMGGASGSNVKIVLAQMSSRVEPYATIDGTTSDRDDIVMRQGNSIFIYKNNNSNGIASSTFIGNLTSSTDFAIGDMNNDGYNDILTCSITQGMKIFLNNGTIIDTNADYTNSNEDQAQSITFADFNKDGWNDMVVNTFDSLNIFINNHGSGLFSQTRTYSIPVGDGSSLEELWTPRMTVVDLQNKGGLSVVQSGFPAITFDEPPYFTEVMYRYNPATIDANPAPAIVFKSVAYVNSVLHPKITMFSRGDRDFNKFKIYTKVPASFSTYTLLDSNFTGNVFIDTTRVIIENETTGSPNLFYYVKCVDNSYKTSINSDTIGFSDEECPDCSGGESPVFISNNAPEDFKISNHPNPFNPSTLISYSLPIDANVKITVFNTLGQIVKELTNEFRTAGNYSVSFDGSNLASGIYYYRLEVGSFIATKKMLLLK
ncbi:MAG: FG-GAP-like repeat-containing protein [bacterium]|nr:FG-GAP-like repeat-containing protein [bacterium]